jgi:glyoxylase-like metal-dependent hydrolase (beta-lactamase superfamily II)
MKEIHHIVVGGIATNCWIYPIDDDTHSPEGAAAVIDPGEEGSRIIAFLDQLKLYPKYIVLSHGHFDHIGAVPALAARYGADAEIAIHTADAEYLGPNSYPVHRHSFSIATGSPAYLDALWEDMPPPRTLLAEGDTIGPFTVLHLPGHTPGSIGLWDKKAGVLFSGDTLFCGNYGRSDLPGGNEAQLLSSLKRLLALAPSGEGDIQVYPGHGPVTSIGREIEFLRGITD